ncbi:MAG: radical SAM protein [Desulfovibrionaceae bacterium]
MEYNYIFGPVASSRLGRSLGLDLLGDRICSFDCLYCEVGATTRRTMERAPYVPARAVLDELAHWKAHVYSPIDHVTLGGSGEPCLNSDLGAIIAGCRAILPEIPVAVLTNATLLGNHDVRRECAAADVVLPSLDSLAEREFARVNRPCFGLTAAGVAQGILDFRAGFAGKLYLEILLVRDVNDSEESLALLADYVRRLAPDRVDVVTMTRPGAFAKALPVPPETLSMWRVAMGAARAGAPAPAADAPGSGTAMAVGAADGAAALSRDRHAGQPRTDAAVADAVYASLRRRPQTVAQLAMALALDGPDGAALVRRVVRDLLAAQRIQPMAQDRAGQGGATGADLDEMFYGVPETGKYQG